MGFANRWRWFERSGGVLLPLALMACGGGASARADAADATVEAAALDDGGGQTVDAAALDDGSGEATAPPDAGTSLLLGGAGLVVKGITNDGFVLYFEPSSLTYFAVGVGGGSPTPILTLTSTQGSFTQVIGNLFLIQTFESSVGRPSALSAWSSSLTAPVPIWQYVDLQYIFTAWASPDSTHIAYVRLDPAGGGESGAVYGVNADGTGQTLLVPDVVTKPLSCAARVAFVGDYAFVSSCSLDAADDGGASDGGTLRHTIRSFLLSSGWQPALTIPDAVDVFNASVALGPFSTIDPTGAWVVAAPVDGGGALQAFPADGGAPGPVIDPDVAFGPDQFVVGSASAPWSVLYTTDAGVLKRSPVAQPAPQVILDGGARYFDMASPDGAWLIVSSNFSSSGPPSFRPLPFMGLYADLTLVSALGSAVPVPLTAPDADTALPVSVMAQPSGAFTSDANYVLFYSDIKQNHLNVSMGYVHAMATAPPNGVQTLSRGYAIGNIGLQGSKVLLFDNFVDSDGGANSRSTVDVEIVDPALPGAPIVLATTVGSVAVSSDKTKIVYSVDWGPAPGIYVGRAP
jgi:hypothetical protein